MREHAPNEWFLWLGFLISLLLREALMKNDGKTKEETLSALGNKRVNKRDIYGVLAIVEILLFRGLPIPESHTLSHPAVKVNEGNCTVKRDIIFRLVQYILIENFCTKQRSGNPLEVASGIDSCLLLNQFWAKSKFEQSPTLHFTHHWVKQRR